jgi:hypothetical protein
MTEPATKLSCEMSGVVKTARAGVILAHSGRQSGKLSMDDAERYGAVLRLAATLQ